MIERPKLSERQNAVLRLMAAGKSTDEIAEGLKVSKSTIRDHTRLILAKLNANGRVHAVAIALRSGLIK
jgi:DNA-binding CsgD family transcriptional regulator